MFLRVVSGHQRNAVDGSPSEVGVPMLTLVLGQLIHDERQREIERRLEVRRLLEPYRPVPGAPVRGPRIGARQTSAGAAP